MSRITKSTVVVFNHGSYEQGKVTSKSIKKGRVVYEVELEKGKTLTNVPVDNFSGNLYINSKISNNKV